MGYRSDVRIRMRKEDYLTLVEKFNDKLGEFLGKDQSEITINDYMGDLFGQTPKTNEEIVEFGKKSRLNVIRVEENFSYYELEDDKWEEKQCDMVYFGWDDIKWYEGSYADISFITDFIYNLDMCSFSRIGEDYEDIEQFAEKLDYMGITRQFDED